MARRPRLIWWLAPPIDAHARGGLGARGRGDTMGAQQQSAAGILRGILRHEVLVRYGRLHLVGPGIRTDAVR